MSEPVAVEHDLARYAELRAAALAVVEHARQTGNITVALRKRLAVALGLREEEALGYYSREQVEARRLRS